MGLSRRYKARLENNSWAEIVAWLIGIRILRFIWGPPGLMEIPYQRRQLLSGFHKLLFKSGERTSKPNTNVAQYKTQIGYI